MDINAETKSWSSTTRPRTSAGASFGHGVGYALGMPMRCAAPWSKGFDATGLPSFGATAPCSTDVAGATSSKDEQTTASGIRGWRPPV